MKLTFFKMRAYCGPGTEISITLDELEVDFLGTGQTIGGKLKMYPESGLPERDLRIWTGIIKETSPNLMIDLKSFPINARFEDIARYDVVVSPEGYDVLEKVRAACDRIGFGTACRVDIYFSKPR